MLRHLVRVEEDAPLLIVGIYRDTERGADLLDTLADLRREHFVETVRLSGLDEQEASELVAALSDRALHTDADRALWRETKGNPFFLEEMVRNTPAGPAEITAIPEGVRTVIRRRLAHHSDDVSRVLAVAARRCPSQTWGHRVCSHDTHPRARARGRNRRRRRVRARRARARSTRLHGRRGSR
jgi:hypothetical protein